MPESVELISDGLKRTVKVDFYPPPDTKDFSSCSLLLINDGQDLMTMNFESILSKLRNSNQIKPLICVGIHCGDDRRNEYGMVSSPDYQGRGSKARLYEEFVLNELFPCIYEHFGVSVFKETAIAGFSLGGLNAMDTAWNHPDIFPKVGVFSGSFWWRSKDQSAKDYNGATDRIMQRHVREGGFHKGMKFFFQVGELDEAEDRNKNGVIDSIDDTLDLMRILIFKGYREGADIKYLQLADGRHDVGTWARALPVFLKWGWS